MSEHAAPCETIDVERLRREFPIFDRPLPNGRPLIFLDSAASAQKPRRVIEKERECYERYYANAGNRGDYQFAVHVDEELEATRAKVRDFIGAAEPEEIVFTSGTTMSINLVAQAWGRRFLGRGDEIVLTRMEHHANLVPWQQVALEKEARLQFVDLRADGLVDLDQFDRLLSGRTRIVAITGMSNVLGTVPPIAEIVKRAKKHGALVLVDGAQSVPHLPTNVLDLGVDFLAFSGHKLYGPTGVGILYGRRTLLEAMDPFLCGGHMIGEVFWDRSTWAGLPAKFEAGTIPIAQAIALGSAIDFVNEIGFPAIHAHDNDLTAYAFLRLSEIPGLTIYGPEPPERGPILSFSLAGIHPQDLANLVDRNGVAVRHGHHCTMPLHELLGVAATTRASFGVYSNRADVDVLVEAIQAAEKRLRRSHQ